MNTINRFNVRVYALLLNPTGRSVLVSQEWIKDKWYTKFPGGGMEYGESTHECLLRESLEEIGQQVEILDHFYTTDTFVQSVFRAQDQILAIYYTCRFPNSLGTELHARQEFPGVHSNEQRFKWIEIEKLSIEQFDFPTDRKVVELLKARS